MSVDPAASSLAALAERELPARIVGFVRTAKMNQFRVGIREEADALRIAVHIGVLERERLRDGLRCLLCSTSADWRRYDELFESYWGRINRVASIAAQPKSNIHARSRHTLSYGGAVNDDVDTTSGDGNEAASDEQGASRGGASEQESLARKDFRLLANDLELRQMEQWLEALAARMRRRLLRRLRASDNGRRVDIRRMIRKNLRYGGMLFDLAFQRRRRELPKLVLILDVSRSMSLYSYLFLRFARGIVDVFNGAQAWVFHTRLVHMTEALRERDALRLKEKLEILSLGWAGGTRIGESLQAFNLDYARGFASTRTFVIIVSDGYDTGDAGLLADQMREIKRRARRVIWLNPLLGRDTYQPVAKGMQAALPYIDLFAPAHNFTSLRAIGDRLVSL